MAALAIQPVFAAPPENKGKETKVHKVRPAHPNNRGRGKAKGKQAHQRLNTYKRNQEQSIKRTHLPKQEPGIPITEISVGENEILSNLEDALNKLQHSRWLHNPNDSRREQGNMGQFHMIAPYGHDKDSDRTGFGNKGRLIRPIPNPSNEPPYEPPPEPPE